MLSGAGISLQELSQKRLVNFQPLDPGDDEIAQQASGGPVDVGAIHLNRDAATRYTLVREPVAGAGVRAPL